MYCRRVAERAKVMDVARGVAAVISSVRRNWWWCVLLTLQPMFVRIVYDSQQRQDESAVTVDMTTETMHGRDPCDVNTEAVDDGEPELPLVYPCPV